MSIPKNRLERLNQLPFCLGTNLTREASLRSWLVESALRTRLPLNVRNALETLLEYLASERQQLKNEIQLLENLLP